MSEYTEPKNGKTPFTDLRADAHKHYEEAATSISGHSSEIPKAIDYYYDRLEEEERFTEHSQEGDYSKIEDKGLDTKPTKENCPDWFATKDLEEMTEQATTFLLARGFGIDVVDVFAKETAQFAQKVQSNGERMPSEEEYFKVGQNNALMAGEMDSLTSKETSYSKAWEDAWNYLTQKLKGE